MRILLEAKAGVKWTADWRDLGSVRNSHPTLFNLHQSQHLSLFSKYIPRQPDQLPQIQ